MKTYNVMANTITVLFSTDRYMVSIHLVKVGNIWTEPRVVTCTEPHGGVEELLEFADLLTDVLDELHELRDRYTFSECPP